MRFECLHECMFCIFCMLHIYILRERKREERDACLHIESEKC